MALDRRDPFVSPAETIRLAREHAGYDDMPEQLREPFLALCDLADALLAADKEHVPDEPIATYTRRQAASSSRSTSRRD